jgi:glycosyltransferase involved in cell wall biosynthesis
MFVHILFNFKDEISGGGSNFLSALRSYFIDNGLYSDSIRNADVVLFNSHHSIKLALDLKMKYPEKLFIQRIDGPMRLYNNSNDKRDLIVNIANKYIADGTIFQSNWSRDNNIKMGYIKNKYEAIFLNSSNHLVFYPKKKNKRNFDSKVKLIAVSWSSNSNKGFEIYSWLDKNLDFDKYEMTFVGNSPVSFKNIFHMSPMNQQELSAELRKNDIFITASKKDPCSNALIEALSCGLPAIALNDGGHPEILSNGGVLFNNSRSLIESIDNVSKNYSYYQNNISIKSINEIGGQYYDFMNRINQDLRSQKYIPKKINYFTSLMIKFKVLCYRAL